MDSLRYQRNLRAIQRINEKIEEIRLPIRENPRNAIKESEELYNSIYISFNESRVNFLTDHDKIGLSKFSPELKK